jgi:hypothetical protein
VLVLNPQRIDAPRTPSHCKREPEWPSIRGNLNIKKFDNDGSNAVEGKVLFMAIAMDTFNKMTRSLTAIRDHVYCTRCVGGPGAKLDLIYVIANETLKECEPEIAEFKSSVSAAFS